MTTQTPMATVDERRDPELWWNIGDEPREVTVRWRHATVAVLINYGDGTPREVLGVNEPKDHIYPSSGAYKVTIRQTGGVQAVLAEAQVIVRDANPSLTIAADPDTPGLAVATAPAGFDGTGIIPQYRVYWSFRPQPTLYTDFWGMPSASVRQQLPAGDYQARVYDLGSKRWVEQSYTIPPRDLDFTTTVAGRQVTLTVTHATTGKDVIVDWGDTGFTQPVEGATAQHIYPNQPGVYVVQLWYADASSSTTKTVEIQGEST